MATRNIYHTLVIFSSGAKARAAEQQAEAIVAELHEDHPLKSKSIHYTTLADIPADAAYMRISFNMPITQWDAKRVKSVLDRHLIVSAQTEDLI